MTTTEPASTIGLDTVAELAAQLRVDSIRSSTSAGSGHPTSSMSAADLLAVLITRHLRYDWDEPRLPVNDHLIFSKGHASPLLYSVFKAVGVVSEDELLNGYRRFGQRLEGHPTPILPWVDVATGSLGQGLPDGVGVALAGKYLERLPYRVWVLCGDSELAEGSIWEAFDKASYYQLSNLIAIADINRLGQRGQTDLGWNLEEYQRRMEAFGARVLTVDGHDLAAIDQAMTAAAGHVGRPAHGDPGQDHQGQGVLRGREQGRLARQAAPARHGRAGDRRTRRRAQPRAARPAAGTGRAGAGAGQAHDRPQQPRHGGQAQRDASASTRSARRSPPGRPTATRSSPWARATTASSRWTARSATRPSPTSSRRPTRSGTSRCSSPSSSSWPRRPGWPSAATARSRPRSRRSSPAPTTSSGWARSPAWTCGWPARTRASRSAPTARRRWRWRTWR